MLVVVTKILKIKAIVLKVKRSGKKVAQKCGYLDEYVYNFKYKLEFITKNFV